MTKEQKLTIGFLKACELLVDAGVGDWKIKPKKTRVSIGQTDFDKKTIFLSEYFVLAATEEQLTGVTMHEIAHVLCGPDVGHGQKFKQKCEEIGVHENYIWANAKTKLGISKYAYECEECGWTGGHNRKFTGHCRHCDAKIEPTKNEIKAVAW